MNRLLGVVCLESVVYNKIKRKCHSLNPKLSSQIIYMAGPRHGLSVTSEANCANHRKLILKTYKCLSEN